MLSETGLEQKQGVRGEIDDWDNIDDKFDRKSKRKKERNEYYIRGTGLFTFCLLGALRSREAGEATPSTGNGTLHMIEIRENKGYRTKQVEPACIESRGGRDTSDSLYALSIPVFIKMALT